MPIHGSIKIRVDTRKYVETFLCIPCIPCENYCTQTSQNCADALRNFAPLREKKDMFLCSSVKHKILCHSVHCFPLTSSDSDFQFCVQIFRYSVLALANYEKIEKSEISNPLGGHLDFEELCCIFV